MYEVVRPLEIMSLYSEHYWSRARIPSKLSGGPSPFSTPKGRLGARAKFRENPTPSSLPKLDPLKRQEESKEPSNFNPLLSPSPKPSLGLELSQNHKGNPTVIQPAATFESSQDFFGEDDLDLAGMVIENSSGEAP
jgi:hypothetical protein